MKSKKNFLVEWISRMIFLFVLMSTPDSRAATTTFTFTIDEPCKTSAGVFKADGTLVRTLWSKVRYLAGTNSAIWDGLDDNSNTAPTGNYQIKLLQHNTEYVWDGAIGNSSAEMSGPTVHRGFYPMRDMAIAGTNAFYVSGYNEGGYDFRNFLTTDPQRLKIAWFWIYSAKFNRSSSMPGDVNDRNWLWTTTDGDWVYFACNTTLNPATQSNNYPGCIVACKVGDNSPATFTKGSLIPNGSAAPFPNGIYVGTQPGLSGLAVQRNGNLLAASVRPDNRVYLIDKKTGASLSNFKVNSAGRMNFSPDGSLWVISENSVICFTNIEVNPSPALTISNLSKPLDVAVNPTNPAIVHVADGGSSQQVKAFNDRGDSLWTYGLRGGYPANGIAVATNKFWFFDGEHEGTFICFAPDGSFWVGDGGNHRSMHFSAARDYLEEIMYQPHSYTTCVDQNNPSRVFNEFLEFEVDYSKPLTQSWKLVNNWKVGVDSNHISWNDGLYEVTTFTNGRTYGLIDNNSTGTAIKELVELTTNGLRLTGIFPMITNQGRWVSLGRDGSARATAIGIPTWYRSTLNGFDANNNPVWNPETLIASAPAGTTDPVPRCCSLGNVRAPISSNNIVIAFDQTLHDGWHLGGIKLGGTNWLWKASPSATWMNGCGAFEIANGVNYPGNTVQAVDRHVIFGYHGEFFRKEGQAAQTMHFLDDGLFVGQFGEASPGHNAYEAPIPAFAGNGVCPNLVKTTNGDFYLWVNDESDHGPQRWHFVNVRNIREMSGTGNSGTTFALTNQPFDFPIGVTGKPGNHSVQISWHAFKGPTSYRVRYSVINGGPYKNIAGTTTNSNFIVSGLANGQTYYFAVSAMNNDGEGMPSEQIEISPFDPAKNVSCVGSMKEAGQFTPVIDVNSTNVSVGQPSYQFAEHLTSFLNLRELCDYGYGDLMNQSVGHKGYVIYGFKDGGLALTNLAPNFKVTPGTGWKEIRHLQRQYRVDNILGAANGAVADPVGSIAIGVSDTNFHFLTVVSPAEFNNPIKFVLKATSIDGTSAVFNVDENIGYSHLFQFLFKGNITLTVDATSGANGIVQALFFDDSAVTGSAESDGR